MKLPLFMVSLSIYMDRTDLQDLIDKDIYRDWVKMNAFEDRLQQTLKAQFEKDLNVKIESFKLNIIWDPISGEDV